MGEKCEVVSSLRLCLHISVFGIASYHSGQKLGSGGPRLPPLGFAVPYSIPPIMRKLSLPAEHERIIRTFVGSGLVVTLQTHPAVFT